MTMRFPLSSTHLDRVSLTWIIESNPYIFPKWRIYVSDVLTVSFQLSPRNYVFMLYSRRQTAKNALCRKSSSMKDDHNCLKHNHKSLNYIQSMQKHSECNLANSKQPTAVTTQHWMLVVDLTEVWKGAHWWQVNNVSGNGMVPWVVALALCTSKLQLA